MKNCPHVTAPYASSPSSLTICSSERKENEGCGLIHRRASCVGVFLGAIAMPLEPPSSAWGGCCEESPYKAANAGTLIVSMSPPIEPSVNESAIQGSNRAMARGFTSGCL